MLDLFPCTVNDKVSKFNYQFDIVGKTLNGLINFECKFQNDPIKASEVFEEKRQAELANGEFIKTIFISKSRVDGADTVYYLPDLFNEALVQ